MRRAGGLIKALVPASAQLVQASFLGVGAPEAFVIAIVALLVFGPKGLAEARSDTACQLWVGLTPPRGTQIAKNLGQTLRAFQPTIKELQQVSQDFKSALDQEVRAGCCAAAGWSDQRMPPPDWT